MIQSLQEVQRNFHEISRKQSTKFSEILLSRSTVYIYVHVVFAFGLELYFVKGKELVDISVIVLCYDSILFFKKA